MFVRRLRIRHTREPRTADGAARAAIGRDDLGAAGSIELPTTVDESAIHGDGSCREVPERQCWRDETSGFTGFSCPVLVIRVAASGGSSWDQRGTHLRSIILGKGCRAEEFRCRSPSSRHCPRVARSRGRDLCGAQMAFRLSCCGNCSWPHSSRNTGSSGVEARFEIGDQFRSTISTRPIPARTRSIRS